MPPRPANSSKASSKPHVGYISMSTVEDLSYTPSVEEKSRDAAQIVATGRRSWKTLKGRGEAVWPPHLEAALIEALEKYKPDEPRLSRASGRFSMRNRFISDYIYESTGKRRTPKQVGSRLQQLRDTCKSEKIMQLISRRPLDNDGDSSGSSYSESPSASPAPENHIPQDISTQRTIWVNLVLDRSWSSPPPVVNLASSEKVMPLIIHLAPSPNASLSSGYGSLGAGLLSNRESRVTIASPYILQRHCSFSVFVEGLEHPIHRESSPLTIHSSLQRSGIMYSASLVPGFWQSLCDCATPTRYTIMQTLFLNQNISGHQKNDAEVSIVYNFTYPESSAEFLPSPSHSTHSSFSSMNEHEQSFDSTLARGWSATALDWPMSFNSHSQLNDIALNPDLNPRFDMHTMTQNSRGLVLPTVSWVNEPRYTQQVLPYC
ncbi:hypothetical protein GYMLUDRAFT_264250 [Collybiopsis luxurians FD-317 M1]|uniref:TEA domain-containing protein n=1 Tax=Collybiopsis luxurians FD-317 M1 TaxID=944289 RepID=A0A0D0CAQ5_9AGAR|nr:hypothetical protein GYMLUDRAFT_264250 [Collybiopsis luxurians FD-317 M1]